MCNFEFVDGKLLPIPDPLNWQDGEEQDVVYSRYGFKRGDGDRIGREYGFHAQIAGPAESGAPYQWAVLVGLNDIICTVWCPTFAELQAYLASISTLLLASEFSLFNEVVGEVQNYLFGYDDGLFSKHVRSVGRLHAERIRQAQARRDAAEAKKAAG